MLRNLALVTISIYFCIKIKKNLVAITFLLGRATIIQTFLCLSFSFISQ